MSSLNYMELCRLCLVKDRVQIPIFEGEGDIRQIFLKIAACLPVKVKKDDKLPKKICDDCMYKVEMLYQFWNTTANAEKQLLEWLGEAVEEKKTNNDTHVKQESMEQDPGSELAKSLSRVEAVLAEAREAESDNDNFAGSNKAETDSDDEPLSSLEPTTFVNVGLNGSGTNESNTQGEFLAPGAPSTSKTNSTNAQMAASGSIKNDINKVKNSAPKEVSLKLLKTVGRDKKTRVVSCKEKDALENKMPCDLCGHYFTKFQMQRHKKRHSMKSHNECQHCGKSFTMLTKLIIHMKTEHGIAMNCGECDKIFNNIYTYTTHMKNHKKEKSMVCDMCGFATSEKSTLENHKLMKHQIGDYPVHCKVCQKGFLNNFVLKEHMNRHTGATPHQCEKCGTAYTSSKSLERHIFKFHPEVYNNKLLKCGICARMFKQRKNLEAHEKSKHGEGNENICDYCGKVFSYKESLVRHRRIHTGEKPKECSICKKRFGCATYLQSHMRTHTGEKPYNCRFCWKKFSQRTSLVTHEKTHKKGLLSSGLTLSPETLVDCD